MSNRLRASRAKSPLKFKIEDGSYISFRHFDDKILKLSPRLAKTYTFEQDNDIETSEEEIEFQKTACIRYLGEAIESFKNKRKKTYKRHTNRSKIPRDNAK